MNQGVEVLRQINWTEYGQSVVHPFALIILFIMSVFLLRSKPTYYLIPFLIIGVFLTHMQRIVIGSLDFSMLRLILIAGGLKAVLKNDINRFKYHSMDYFIILYVLVSSIAYVALRQTSSAMVNRLGFAFEILLAYFLIRLYIVSLNQIIVFVRILSIVFAVVALFMTIEQLTQYNLFSLFGGVSEITGIREGRIRAQGAFSHPILAGTFGASFMPLFWGLWSIGDKRDRYFSILGIICSLIITWASSSSGPVLTLLAGIFAIVFFKYRQYTKLAKTGTIFMLLGLDIVMKAPVWHLISRIDIVGGSTGYQRYALIDKAIKYFPDWAVFGIRSTGHWGWGLNDITNMFIFQGINGGVGALIFFVLIIHAGFNTVIQAMNEVQDNIKVQNMYWAWGSVLFAHCVSFFGVSYFGQMFYFWNLTLGVIACLPAVAKNTTEFKSDYNNSLNLQYK